MLVTLFLICGTNAVVGECEMFLHAVGTVEYVDMWSDATQWYFQFISINANTTIELFNVKCVF